MDVIALQRPAIADPVHAVSPTVPFTADTRAVCRMINGQAAAPARPQRRSGQPAAIAGIEYAELALIQPRCMGHGELRCITSSGGGGLGVVMGAAAWMRLPGRTVLRSGEQRADRNHSKGR